MAKILTLDPDFHQEQIIISVYQTKSSIKSTNHNEFTPTPAWYLRAIPYNHYVLGSSKWYKLAGSYRMIVLWSVMIQIFKSTITFLLLRNVVYFVLSYTSYRMHIRPTKYDNRVKCILTWLYKFIVLLS